MMQHIIAPYFLDGSIYPVMNLTPEEVTTVKAYNKHAKAWASTHDDDDFYEEEYKQFVSLLPKGKILEIGCGAGRDAVKLTALGYGYLGTDVADKLLESARRRVPDAAFEVTDIYSMNFTEKFDGFWCAAVLLHIPRHRVEEALKSIKRQLKPGGIGFISTKQGILDTLDPLPYDTTSKRLQVHYSKEELDKTLAAVGFEVLHYSFRPLSERAQWMCYFVRNASS